MTPPAERYYPRTRARLPERRWIKQPHGSKLCGQVAVAVVAGLDLETCIDDVFFGHRGGTTTRRLVEALTFLGIPCGDRLRPSRRPELAIAKLAGPLQPAWSSKAGGFVARRPQYRWHWVVVDGDLVWDGGYGNARGEVAWPDGHALTSYLGIGL